MDEGGDVMMGTVLHGDERGAAATDAASRSPDECVCLNQACLQVLSPHDGELRLRTSTSVRAEQLYEQGSILAAPFHYFTEPKRGSGHLLRQHRVTLSLPEGLLYQL